MSERAQQEANEAAFSWPETKHTYGSRGLTKREYFAAMALQGYLASYAGGGSSPKSNNVAKMSVEYADALLKELYPENPT